MSELEAGLQVGNKGIQLLDKVIGPFSTRWQATADAQATVQGALATRLATIIEHGVSDPETLDLLISCGGKASALNLAKIVQKAEQQLADDANPSDISEDWSTNFRDKARTCSDDEIANLWAQLLASEANNPGSRSRKSVNILADMDRADAELFSTLCRFRLITFNFSNLRFSNSPPPSRSRFNTAPAPPLLVVLDGQHPMYTRCGIDFESLSHLEGLGLVKVLPQGYTVGPGKVAYVCENRNIALSSATPIQLGIAYFTTAGSQLSELCFPLDSPEGFADYLTQVWQGQGITVSDDINEVLSIQFEVRYVDPKTGEEILAQPNTPDQDR